jgi:hypothetical protein
LVIGEEFVQHARTLGLLCEDDKPIVRLWAGFADPRRKGSILRERVGLPLAGVRCRGFKLHVGMDRKGACLFWAKRAESGEWDCGPSSWRGLDYIVYAFKREVLNQKNCCEHWAYQIDLSGGPEQQPGLARELEQAQQALATAEEKYRAAQAKLDVENAARARLLVLACERVIEFGGGDHFTQMIAGARVSGHCAICGKTLTDPTSVEYGIGPDCRAKHSAAIDAWVARQQPAAA